MALALLIENPSRSFLSVTEGIQSVHALPGVVFISVMFGNFGAGSVKPTHLLSNVRDLWRIKSVVLQKVVDEPITLRGFLKRSDGTEQALTSIACPYPPFFALAIAEIIKNGFTLFEKMLVLPGEDDNKCDGNPMLMGMPVLEPPPVVDDNLENAEEEEVQYGGGAKVGLSYEQHFVWAHTIEHPFREHIGVPMKETEFWNALEYEATTTAEEIDSFRWSVIAKWKAWALELEPERKKWLNTKVPKRLREMLKNFHLPLFERILQSIDYEDMAVVERMTTGFYFAGVLDPSNVDTVPCEVQPTAITMKVAVIIINNVLLVIHFILVSFT